MDFAIIFLDFSTFFYFSTILFLIFCDFFGVPGDFFEFLGELFWDFSLSYASLRGS